MDFHYFIYQSTAADHLSANEIDSILASAKAFNKKSNITGVLLYDESNFLQFIEGPKSAVSEAYQRIKSASQHHAIFELANEPSQKKYFKDWDMGFCKTTKTTMQAIADANWVKSIQNLRKHNAESDGLALLLDYWDSFKQDTES
ncbi:MAG: BLUF domain-containing protein [Methylophilaceae bacterium]